MKTRFSTTTCRTTNNFFFAAHQVGPNSFTTDVTIPHSKLVDSEPSYGECDRVVCPRSREHPSSVSTDWADSQTEDVRYE